MSDTSNPFSAPEARSRSGVAGSIIAWSMAVIALGAAVVFFTLRTKENAAHQREKEVLREELDKTAADLFNAVATLQTNSEYIVYLTNQISALAKEKESVGQRAKTLEEEMREQLESKDVTISKLQGRLTVTIVDRVMFDSGEAVLKPDGAAVMQKIADLLASHPELKIHVIGHTDNVPIRQTAQSRFASNWELSTARALAAVHFLTEKAGVAPRRLGAVGYGEFRPIADNSTAEGRAKNRRIAITVLPEELAYADDVSMAQSRRPGVEVVPPGNPLQAQ
jgi:chemotaxis protein MotB